MLCCAAAAEIVWQQQRQHTAIEPLLLVVASQSCDLNSGAQQGMPFGGAHLRCMSLMPLIGLRMSLS